MIRKLVELQRGRHNGVFQRGDTRGEQQRENGKLHGRAGLQTARYLSCIIHRFGFCVFRTLDRAVRECVPYGCAFLTKGNAARWCVFSGNALFIHTCCPAQTTIPVQDANGKLFVAVIGSSRPWTVIYVQDRSRDFPDGILRPSTVFYVHEVYAKTNSKISAFFRYLFPSYALGLV